MTRNETQAETTWPTHVIRSGAHTPNLNGTDPKPDHHKEHVEPWLSALLQAEHLNLVIGSGLTTALAMEAGAPTVDMAVKEVRNTYAFAVRVAAANSAERLGRGDPNIEDQIRAVQELIGGLQTLAGVEALGGNGKIPDSASTELDEWEAVLNDTLVSFLKQILDTERGINQVLTDVDDSKKADNVRRLLGGFLLPFASRTASRERLHIFTTNYDRVVEHGCDLLGLRVLDRFLGNLSPVFRSSRLGVDLHYNPPGIRGEPRYLEGVVRLTKLHGSLDWRARTGPSGRAEVQRCALPFGAAESHPEVSDCPGASVLVYPNAAKDVETLEYPYADLFRDFAAATCRPNSVVVTYGYGFGDDHVNRVLSDMLTIPSTHLVIISYDDAAGRLCTFCDRVARDVQITLLVGPHFGDLSTLVENYLPKPAIDRATWRMMDLLRRRARPRADDPVRTNEGSEDGIHEP